MRLLSILRSLPSVLLALAALMLFSLSLTAQQTNPPPPAPDSAQQPAASTPATEAKGSSSSSGRKSSALPAYLILGTVFNENSLAFPNVEIRIRRANEKKFRWEAYTNSRGEFAVRVPDGQEYEIFVRTKKYQEQKRTISTHIGDIEQRLSFKLEPVTATNNGAKK
jgi:hypothetical protein